MKTDKDIAEAAKIAFRYSGVYAASFILAYEKPSAKKKAKEKLLVYKKSPSSFWFFQKLKNKILLKMLFRR
jgi:hypothetical protein